MSGFGFSVGDIILVSQLSWKTWQACTSGRKAAPGEFAVVESELWALSSALEQLASHWSAENDILENDIPDLAKEEDGLKVTVLLCKGTIEEFNVFLDKYRPACSTSEVSVEWTTRAKHNWRKIMWGTQKKALEAFRSRIDSHIQRLNTLIHVSERRSLKRIEEKVNQMTIGDSNVLRDDESCAETLVTPSPPENLTEESLYGLVTLPLRGKAGYFDIPISTAAELWLGAVKAFAKSYHFTYAQRQMLGQSISDIDYRTRMLDAKRSRHTAAFALGLVDWLQPPLPLKDAPEFIDVYSAMLAMACTTINIMDSSFVSPDMRIEKSILQLADQFRSLPQEKIPLEISQVDTYQLRLVYLQFLTEMVKQFAEITKVARNVELKIYPPEFCGNIGGKSLRDNIERLYLECHLQHYAKVPQRRNSEQDILFKMWDRYIEAHATADPALQKGSDFSSSIQGLRTWLQPPEEVDEELTLQQSRQWPSTCSWIFTKQSYREWFASETSTILWFHARPGAGKSVLASHLSELFDKADETSAYYCFRYNDDVLRSPQSLLRSFAFQIAQNHQVACSHLLSLRDKGITIATSRIGVVWKKLFLDTLLKTPFERPVYLIVDALDEADPSERLPFLNFLSDISKSSNNFKIVIFSRYLRDIATKFSQISIPVEEITPDDNGADISLFARERLDRSPHLGELSLEILPKLTSQSNGSFIWVTKVLDALDIQDSRDDILRTLDDLPAGMDELYDRILHNMAQNTSSQIEYSQTILRWVICTYRPLLLQEMSFVVQDYHGMVPNIHSLIRNTCGQLVSVDKSQRVQANHLTIYEYLTRGDICPAFQVNLPLAHEELALFCLDYLSRLNKLDDMTESAVLRAKFEFVEYAATFWSHHVVKSPYSSALYDQIIDFLGSGSFLHWIQALSTLSNLKYLEATVSNLENWARKEDSSNLLQHLTRLHHMASQLGYAAKVYSGALVGDKKHGFGTCKYENGEFYEGNWENDLRHGFGENTYADGQKYVGWWQRDEFHGQGTLESADGCKYVGEWVAGRKQGYGIMTWAWMERVSYRGTWKDDRPHGKGTVFFFLGSRYDGDWYEGCEQGIGKTMYWQGNHFEGEFKGGYEVGQIKKGSPKKIEIISREDGGATRAKLWFGSGGVYEGEIDANNMPHGQGVLTASTGIVYTGAFHDGFFHGPGIARRPNGGMMRGTWVRSVAVGHFEDVSDKPGGGRYEGDFADTSRHGQGTLYSASGYVYKGAFRYNEMHGEGTRTYKDGTLYIGSSAHGSIHGHGKMIYASSAVYEGEWNNNKKHGKGRLTFPEGHVFTGVWANGLATKGTFEFAS